MNNGLGVVLGCGSSAVLDLFFKCLFPLDENNASILVTIREEERKGGRKKFVFNFKKNGSDFSK